MRLRDSLCLASVLALTLAQSSTDLLSVLASEAYTVFSSVTPTATGDNTVITISALSSIASLTSPPATQLTGFATLTSTLPSTTGTQSSFSDTSQTGPTSATAASSPTQSANNSDHHGRTVAIVLGTIFGVIGLGFVILTIILFYRRRARRNGTARAGYAAPLSDGDYEPYQPDSSRVNPVTATAAAPYPTRSLASGSHPRIPLMSERSNPDLPIPYKAYSKEPQIPGAQSAHAPYEGPFIETGRIYVDESKDFAVHPTYGGSQTSLGIDGGIRDDSGVTDAGPATAGRSMHQADHDESMSGDIGLYSSFLNGPTPPRTPHSTTFNGADGSTDTLLRGASDMAAASSTHSGGHNRERSRRPSTPISHFDGEQSNATSSASRWEIGSAVSGFDHSGPYEMPVVSTPPAGRSNINPMDRHIVSPPNSAFIVTSGGGAHSRTRSRPQTRTRAQPPLPPSLTIPKANQGQSTHSANRSPKRARFTGNDTFHEPAQYSDSTSLRSSQISTPTTHASPWTPHNNPSSAGTYATDDLVSPISPDDSFARINQGMPVTAARANLVTVPRNRDPSSNQHPQYASQGSSPSTLRISRETSQSSGASSRQSGLINAVQGQFHLRPVYTRQHSHDPFVALGSPHRSSFLNLDHTPSMVRRNQKAITRKPVPTSSYQPIRPARAASNLQPVKENWWKESSSDPSSSSQLIPRPPAASQSEAHRLSADQWREQVDLAWHSDYDDEDDNAEGNIINRNR